MATQLDWYNTFLSNDSGKKVLFELRQILTTRFRAEGLPISPETALAQCILDDTVMLIDERCGINTQEAEMEMIDAQAIVAAAMLERQEEEEKEDVDLHKTN